MCILPPSHPSTIASSFRHAHPFVMCIYIYMAIASSLHHFSIYPLPPSSVAAAAAAAPLLLVLARGACALLLLLLLQWVRCQSTRSCECAQAAKVFLEPMVLRVARVIWCYCFLDPAPCPLQNIISRQHDLCIFRILCPDPLPLRFHYRFLLATALLPAAAVGLVWCLRCRRPSVIWFRQRFASG